MAAPPSKPSPSKQTMEGATLPVENDSNATSAAPQVASTVKAAPVAPAAALKAPPVADTETASATVTAKATATLLDAHEPSYDDSEKSDCYVLAKTFLNAGDFEQALSTIEEGIEGTRAILTAAGVKEDDITLHASLAPFHYMYGTTLLYSIEESTDSQAMTTTGGGDDDGGGEDGADGGEGDEDQDQEPAEDMQISWENLEMARTILERLLVTHGSTDKIQLDLAQVLLREGDLQRLNGRYDCAIQDYGSCLKLREGNQALGPYDRKIADVHYNLGLNYMMRVADAKGAAASQEDPETAAAAAPADTSETALAEMRSKSFYHYLACSKTLCGQLAFLANENPAAFLQKAEADIPKFKSTGEDDDDDAMDHPKIVGLKLQALRKHVAMLTPPEEHQDLFLDLNELLQEIQETIDEAENSEKGVQQVSEMKAEISAAVAAQPGVGEEEGAGDGATTAIGFGSAAATASTATAQPIMAIKKKNKRPVEDAKMPAQEDTKRPKNE